MYKCWLKSGKTNPWLVTSVCGSASANIEENQANLEWSIFFQVTAVG